MRASKQKHKGEVSGIKSLKRGKEEEKMVCIYHRGWGWGRENRDRDLHGSSGKRTPRGGKRGAGTERESNTPLSAAQRTAVANPIVEKKEKGPRACIVSARREEEGVEGGAGTKCHVVLTSLDTRFRLVGVK